MENNTTKVEVMKPVLLKAGIPLAITVAGFILARLTQRRSPMSKTSPAVDSQKQHEDESNLHILESHDSSCLSFVEEEDINPSSIDPSPQNTDATFDLFQMESLKSRVQQLQDGKLELELELKEKEMMLLELHTKLLMEISRLELIEKEERQTLEILGLEYLKIVKLLAFSRSLNRSLRKRVKKLLKKIKQQSRVIKEQSLQIEAQGAEISRNYEQLETGANVLRKMEVEMEDMKTATARLQMEKNGLANQIGLANKTISSKIEEEAAIKAGYDRVLSEMEQLEKERAVEAKELIYLRWCSACLRHELLRRSEEQQARGEADDHVLKPHPGEISDVRSDDEIDHSRLEHASPPYSKKGKLIQKLKRWMDGNEKTKGEK